MAQLMETDADAPPRGVRVHASLPGSERRGLWATLLSLLLHGLVIFIALRLTAAAVMPEHSPLGDAIRLALGGGGGGGGQGGVAVQHAAAPPPPTTQTLPPVVPPPPPPVPTVIPPPPAATEPPPAAASAPPAANTAATAGTGTGTGGGNGSGTGTGTGSGEGPGSGSGKGGGTGGGMGGFPPENKQLSIPSFENVPKELRAKAVEVTFFVTAAGIVSDVTVSPAISNKGFAKKFDEVIRGFTFKPARDSLGNKVAGVAHITVTFFGKP